MSIIEKIFNKKEKDLRRYEPVVDKKKSLMFINRILARKDRIKWVLIIIDILFLLAFDYIVNSFAGIGYHISTGNGTMEDCFKWVNILPSISLIFKSSLVRRLYALFFIMMAVLDLSLAYQIKISYSDEEINKGKKGSNRWTTKEEIKEQYKEIEIKDAEYSGYPGTLISEFDGKCYIDTSFTNNLYIGITRSGKGETAVLRNADIYTRAEIKPSVVYFDPKAEIFKCCKDEYINRGYYVFFMNLENPELSMGFNPLTLIVKTYKAGDVSHAEDLANSLSFSIFNPEAASGNEKYFVQSAASLFVGMIMALTTDAIEEDRRINKKRKLAYEQKAKAFLELQSAQQEEVRKEWNEYQKNNLDMFLSYDVQYIPDNVEYFDSTENEKTVSIYTILMLFMKLTSIEITVTDPKTGMQIPTGETAFDEYFKQRPDNDRAKFKYTAIKAAKSHRTIGNIYSTMLSKLTIFSYESVAKMTAESSLNLRDIGFGEKPIAIFIGAPDYDKSKHVLASIFVKQLYFACAEGCWDKGACKRPIRIVGDEIGSFPEIEGMDNIITVCAGRHINFDLYIQSEAQLEEVYKGAAKTIMDNCANKIFILTDNDDTIKSFSNKIGNEEVTDLQRTGSKFSLKKTFMESTREKPLMPPDHLAKLFMGENVIKRTIKRKDNNQNDIEPTPIYNSIEEGMRISSRYEILEDKFPSPTGISLQEKNKESRLHINLEKRLWNPEITFRQFQQNIKKGLDETNKTLSMLPEDIKKAVHRVIQKIMGDTYDESKVDGMTVSSAEEMIRTDNFIKEYEKRAILITLNSVKEKRAV